MRRITETEEQRSEFDLLRERIAQDELHRETREEGRKYLTRNPSLANPFLDRVFNMVIHNRDENIVLHSVYDAVCLEVRSREVILSEGLNLPRRVLKFEPSSTDYLFRPPFFVEATGILSHYLQRALENPFPIVIETDVESPFRRMEIK